MSERGLHYIEDDLTETWVEDWAGAGVEELQDYLAKRPASLDPAPVDPAEAEED